MKKSLLLFILFCLIVGCEVKYEFWDISIFHFDETALEDQEEIYLIYTSKAPDDNKNKDYYIHYICVRQSNKDTINVLSTYNFRISKKDAGKSFVFFGQNNPVVKTMGVGLENFKNLNVDEINNFDPMKIKKVARDPRFDFIADNDFPTVFGVIGTISGDGVPLIEAGR